MTTKESPETPVIVVESGRQYRFRFDRRNYRGEAWARNGRMVIGKPGSWFVPASDATRVETLP